MAKPLSLHVKEKFAEQRRKVHFEAQVVKLISQCDALLETDEIKHHLMENREHWNEVLKHFVLKGWNVRIEGDYCWIWQD